MRLKFKTDIEIKPIEWIYIIMAVIAVVLLATGNVDKAITFIQSCLQWLGK